MAQFELKLPKMGESVAEATITTWLKEVGDTIEMDEAVVEIATDKVDSEVPSEVDGVLKEILFSQDDVVQVGQTIAIIEIEGEGIESDNSNSIETVVEKSDVEEEHIEEIEKSIEIAAETVAAPIAKTSESGRFYSPLVRNIAQTEGISIDELENIAGSGKDGRVTKDDILAYIENKDAAPKVAPVSAPKPFVAKAAPVSVNGGDEIIEMTRMGKLISKHMVDSVQTSAHVQSFIEIDVTNIVKWRNKVKNEFFQREGEKLTFTPIFMQAVAAAIRKYPLINISVQGDSIIKKKNINLGMAAALPDGNLIVPVIKNADQLNLVGMTKQVNDLANRARGNQLKPDEIQDGT